MLGYRYTLISWREETVRLRLCACFVLVAVFGLGSHAQAASPFDGTWSGLVVRTAGNQQLTITLKSDEAGRVTGSLAGQADTVLSIEWGMLKGDLIAFKVNVPGANNQPARTFVYLGKIEGDQVAFGRRPEDLSVGFLVEFTAKRAK